MNISQENDADILAWVSKRPSSRRTRSFSCSSLTSSSSSSSSSSMSFPSNYKASPLRLSGNIPFSWEQRPGIPKEAHTPTSKDGLPCQDLMLPLPPAALSTAWKKKSLSDLTERDPFIAALMECSKDHLRVEMEQSRWKGAKVSRSLSDRFGSCKGSCSVTDSTITLRKPNRHPYHMLNRRSG